MHAEIYSSRKAGHCAEAGKDRRRYLSWASGVVVMPAKLLQGQQPQVSEKPERLGKALQFKRSGFIHCFHLSRYCMPAHSPELREQTTYLDGREAIAPRSNF
jgi:hypothetical protein